MYTTPMIFKRVIAFSGNGYVGFLRKMMQTCLLVSVFCVIQAMCGCALLGDIFDNEGPIVYEDLATFTEDDEPTIRPGLLLRIGVTASGSSIQDSVQEVGEKGELLMPLIGALACTNLTVTKFQEKIEEAYSAYFITPQATVGFAYDPNNPVGKSPWGEVLVMGSVLRSGPVNMPPTKDLKVMKALMLAGGITPLGDKKKVRVSRREKDGTLTRFKVNVQKIGEKGRGDLDLKLKPGDVIWVPESWY